MKWLMDCLGGRVWNRVTQTCASKNVAGERRPQPLLLQRDRRRPLKHPTPQLASSSRIAINQSINQLTNKHSHNGNLNPTNPRTNQRPIHVLLPRNRRHNPVLHLRHPHPPQPIQHLPLLSSLHRRRHPRHLHGSHITSMPRMQSMAS